MNSNFVSSEPLLKPHYSTVVSAYGPWQLHKNAHSMGPILACSTFNISYKDHVSNVSLYRSLPPISLTFRYRRLQFAGYCYRRVDEPVYSILFFESSGTFRPGGHARVSYIKTPLRDSGLYSVNDLSTCHVMSGEWSALGSTSTALLRRRTKKKNI